MLRLIAYIFVLVLLAFGGVWLADNPGRLTLFWLGWRIDTSASFLFAAFLACVLLVLLVLAPVNAALRSPARFRARRGARAYGKALVAATDGITALMLADATQADKSAKALRKYIGDAPITHLLSAQAAKLTGNTAELRTHLEALMEHESTRFLAARTLAEVAAREGSVAQALAYANEASALNRKDTQTLATLVGLHMRQRKWTEAFSALDTAQHRRGARKAALSRIRAMIYAARAEDSLNAHDLSAAITNAQEALKLEPGHAGIALLLADALKRSGDDSAAVAVLAKAWKHHPHITLATALAESLPQKDALKRGKKLQAMHPARVEGYALLGAAAMHVREWEAARRALKAGLTVKEHPTLYLLLAELETRALSDTEAAAEWKAKVAAVKPEHYICTSCNYTDAIWHALCPECSAFAQMEWK